ncbi:1-deoxy-D-xylulose-5-phosphate reductoisomerase [Ruminococcaceae bacterium OttesenSCG-928-L11]|nr:1-deoxy-D-xylulose-5-phosphate reductoisomerase [Ruminococcaceae bacterium OttesenSCG-928-L11]
MQQANTEPKRISLLGSTGSIGVQSLDVIRRLGYRAEILVAKSNIKLLEQQAREFSPSMVVIENADCYPALKAALADTSIRVEAGPTAVTAAAMHPATVLNAIVGIAGLRPTVAALQAGNPVALANKESLVTGGKLVMDLAEKKGVPLYPIDSEHSAIWQCLGAGKRDQLSKIILTGSGGPFFGMTAEQLSEVTVEQALRHPNWAMGAKITIDSATLMNKGLEFIEAMWLFDLYPDQIEVLINRESVIHSAVEFQDGSVIAQLGVPDMRGAIQYALTYPDHLPLEGKRLSLADYGTLTFARPDTDTFLCLKTCMETARQGGLAPTVVNGANEQAVALFLDGKLPFIGIGELVTGAMRSVKTVDTCTLDAIEEADAMAREYVQIHMEHYARRDR